MPAQPATTNTAWAPTPAGIILLLAILGTAGCDAVLTTAQLPPVREDGILGEWKDLGTPGSTLESDPVAIRFTDGAYRMGSPDQFAKGNASPFTLGRVGSVLIAQSPSENQCDEFGTPKGQPCWRLNRVELMRDRMNWYDFDAQRLGRESFSGTLNVAHSIHRQSKKDSSSDTTILLYADSSELRLFLESYVKRRGVFRLTGRFQRSR
jgi:hypothetical protein